MNHDPVVMTAYIRERQQRLMQEAEAEQHVQPVRWPQEVLARLGDALISGGERLKSLSSLELRQKSLKTRMIH